MFSKVLQELRRMVRTLDPATLSGPQAVALLDTFTEIERLAVAARTVVAARAVDTTQWRSDGDRSPEEWLARRTGSSWRDARSVLETAERLQKLPTTEAAVRAGRLSAVQASWVSKAAAADPDVEHELLDAAPQESVRELERRCEAVLAAKRS